MQAVGPAAEAAAERSRSETGCIRTSGRGAVVRGAAAGRSHRGEARQRLRRRASGSSPSSRRPTGSYGSHPSHHVTQRKEMYMNAIRNHIRTQPTFRSTLALAVLALLAVIAPALA